MRVGLCSVTVVTPMLARCKVCQGPINKQCCHLMSSWAKSFDAICQNQPFREGSGACKRLGPVRGDCLGHGEWLAQVGEHKNDGRSVLLLLTWGSGERGCRAELQNSFVRPWV